MLSRLRYGAAAIIPNRKFPRPFVSFSSYVDLYFNPSVVPPSATMLSRLRRYGGAAAAAADSDVVPFSAIKNDITAHLWFDIILSRGTGSISDYNTLLSFLLKQGAHTTVISLAQKLESRSDQIQVFPDIDTWKILITCYSRKGYMASAFSLFDKIIKTGHRPSTPILNDLFEGLSLQGEIHKALLVYNDFLLKGFKLDYVSYDILIEGLCKIGETEKAIELLRQVKIVGGYSNFYVRSFYNNIIFRLCKDRLVNQAYDLYSEMIVKKIMPGAITYHNLIYGYCIVGQFKQAIALFRKLEAYMNPSVYVPTLVTEGEVKAAKSTIALMIKGGVKPIVASFHSVIDELYKGEGRVDKIAQMVETLRRFKPKLEQYYSD